MAANLTPQVSVVMSVYNGAAFLREAVDSILGQSFQDFEFIIINDGSTDETPHILRSYRDQRLRIITQTNQGLVTSLNTGIRTARGELIARQDADDRSAPSRLAKQVAYLREHPDLVLVGSNMAVINSNGDMKHHHRVLLRDPEMRQELLIRSPVPHGSVVFRRGAAVQAGLYRQDYWPAEDYDLWVRLSAHGKLAAIDEPLYEYREHEGGISSANQQSQVRQVGRIRVDAWNNAVAYSGTRIDLDAYHRHDHVDERINRIIGNTRFASRKALGQGKPLLAARFLRQLAADPTIYRKLAGTMKRKAQRYQNG